MKVKYLLSDGAPAVFCGTDPRDGEFFVAKKGIFAKSPKVYKSNADIDADTSGDLNTKLKLALKHLPELGIKGYHSRRFLYSKSDVKTQKIKGKLCYLSSKYYRICGALESRMRKHCN